LSAQSLVSARTAVHTRPRPEQSGWGLFASVEAILEGAPHRIALSPRAPQQGGSARGDCFGSYRGAQIVLTEIGEALYLKRANVTYEELAGRLKKHGLPGETENSIKSKLKRGTFAATFLLACLAALELEGLRLEEI
jgi:hypothetical protein